MFELEFVEPIVEFIAINCEDTVFASPGGPSIIYCSEIGKENLQTEVCLEISSRVISGGDTGEDW